MRPRKKDRHLPKCVYFKHGSYWYVKQNKWTKIGTNLQDALIEYARIIAPADGLMPDLIDKALPHIIEDKAHSTVAKYKRAAGTLKEVFAEFRPEEIRHGDVVQMMDLYKENYSIGNHMLTVLRMTYLWALDRGLVEVDPTRSVKRYKQQTRKRLITHEEYRAIHKNCPDWLKDIIDMCYYTGQRIGDVLSITYDQFLPEGILFEQQKTDHRLIIGWSQEMIEIIERVKKQNEKYKDNNKLFVTRGGRFRAHTNVWRVFKKAVSKAGLEDITLHDIRAMSGTEAEKQGIDPQKLLGHTDSRTTQIYLRDKSAQVIYGPQKK